MSMMTVPSLAPGARTLPDGLRNFGHRNGAQRLYGNMAPLTEAPDPRISLGDCVDDIDTDTGMACGFVDASTLGLCFPGGVDANGNTVVSCGSGNSTAPVVITTQNSDGSTSSQSMTPAQLTALINAGSSSLTKILAITQGGSVLANGSIIGSQQAAQLAAAQSALNISTAGLAGVLSNPLVLIGGLAFAVLLMNRGR